MTDPALLTKLCVALFVTTSLLHAGLALTVAQVRSPLRDRRLVLGALIGNFVLVPAAAMLIARLFDLSDGLSLGLLLVAMSAGAPFLPRLVELARGNAALGVVMMLLLLVTTLAYLHASLLASERLEDLMTAEFAVVPAGGDVPAAVMIAVHSDHAAISGVTKRTDAASASRSLRYALVSEQATALAPLSALLQAEAELVLVSRDRDARRAADVVGVVTPAALAHLLKTDEELL